MFTPVLLFAFAGIVVGLGTLFTTEIIVGPIAAKGTTWYNVWSVILAGGWTVFNQLPLLFAIALPIGLARKQSGRCCMEVLVSYLTFNYFVNAILTAWGPALGVDFTAEVGKCLWSGDDRRHQDAGYGHGWSPAHLWGGHQPTQQVL